MTFVDEWLVLEAIKQVAKGYALKDVGLTKLVRAIHAIRRGESAFDAHSASVVVRSLHSVRTRKPNSAPPTEHEILHLVAREMSSVAISQRLYISEATMKVPRRQHNAETSCQPAHVGRLRATKMGINLTVAVVSGDVRGRQCQGQDFARGGLNRRISPRRRSALLLAPPRDRRTSVGPLSALRHRIPCMSRDAWSSPRWSVEGFRTRGT
jgi:hypothetical protein